ncbi:MAG: hypothetical protein ACM3KR_07490 [Deltaproteobacteria bacterium]
MATYSISINNILKISMESKPAVYFTGELLGFNFLVYRQNPRALFSLKVLNISKENIQNIWFFNAGGKYIVLINEKGIKVFDRNGKEAARYAIEDNNRIVSSFTADMDKIGEDYIILVTGKEGEQYGRKILMLSFDNASANKLKVKYSYQFKGFDVWKVQAADVDGDKKKDISFGAYKKTPLHQIYAKRPFVYNWENGGISPKWLGSRLSMPFEDYIFQDINCDGMDELISIEVNRQGQKLISLYRWKGFGFEGIASSKGFEDISDIKRGTLITGNPREIVARIKENNIWKWTVMINSTNRMVSKKFARDSNLLGIFN